MNMSRTSAGLADRETRSTRRFADLSVVTLAHAVVSEGKMLPTGAKGTVVAVYCDDAGYEVEFDQPFHAVVTVDAGDLAT